MLENLNNEAITLLYLSGELSPEQRTRVDAMLQRDAALRQQLDELRAAQGVVTDLLSRSDATLVRAGPSRPLVISEAAASRKVARAMAQWRIDWLARPRSEPASRRGKWQTLVPAAVAAGILLGSVMYVWWSWSSRPEPTSLVQNTAVDPEEPASPDKQNEDDAARIAAIAGALAMHTPDESELAGVEQQLSALNYLSDSSREDGVSR